MKQKSGNPQKSGNFSSLIYVVRYLTEYETSETKKYF